MNDQRHNNRRTALKLGVAAVAMIGFSFLLVPLYNTFCELTGLNGKTAVIDETSATQMQVEADRWVTVYLDTTTNDSLPWGFQAATRSVRVQPGKIAVVNYWIENPDERAGSGRAIPSMAPARASTHFNKIECFCFQEQRLAAGERRELEMRFVIDPQLPRDLEVLTLSYTLFPILGEKQETLSGQERGDKNDV